MIDKLSIQEVLPELEYIKDEKVREQCADTFIEALKTGGWSSIKELEQIPVLPNRANCPGRIEFIREVAALAADQCDCVFDWVDELAPCEKDIIVAAALLVDIGIYVISGPDPVEKCALLNKAEWAGYLAQKNGLPAKVVYILLTCDPSMAPEGAKAIFTNELRFVRSSYYTLLAALI